MLLKSPPKLSSKAGMATYLEKNLWSWMRELSSLITKINFEENFQSFIIRDVSIAAGEEVSISNQFKNRYPGLVPSGRIIIRQTGDANIIDGDQGWSVDALYLKNPSENNAVVSILFFR